MGLLSEERDSSAIVTENKVSGFGAKEALHCATIFLSAFLLFSIQPVVGRRLLPWFGGAASVWAACTLFFQTVLLLGYLYAHSVTRLLNERKQAWCHGILLAAGCIFLPIQLRETLGTSVSPPLRIAAVLLAGVGFPYFLLSATSPLVQVWNARATGRPPYRLYALSNAASLLALVSYPVLVEPFITAQWQFISWSAGFALFAVLCGVSAIAAREPGKASTVDSSRQRSIYPKGSTTALWIALAAIPSALFLATANHLCQNVAAVPFLWIVPMVVYLLTLILCFDYHGPKRHRVFRWLAPLALVGMAYACLHSTFNANPRLLIPLFAAGLFIVCMCFHGELVNRKPDPFSLTFFYLTISFGGVVGSAVVVWLAPLVLTGVYELPCLLTASMMFLLMLYYRRNWYTDAVFATASIAVLVFTSTQVRAFSGGTRVAMRNFYGALRIVDLRQDGNGPWIRSMVHGVISHGAQFQDPNRREVPTTYYAQGTGAQIALQELRLGPQTVGLIGLGAGTLAAYAQPGDRFVFYELNPQVIDLARREFTFLNKPGIELVEGDGRLALQRDARKFDTIVLDAFSGDAIPTHLLTREAMDVYLDHLKPEGLIAMHISNSVLDLEPAVERLVESARLTAVLVHTSPDPRVDRFEAFWVLMSGSKDRLNHPGLASIARPLRGKPGQHVWTDDYSNLFQLLKAP